MLIIYSVVTYNAFIKKDEQVKLKWSEVQNAYQRRIDFIPNIVSVVRGQADFEQSTLVKVVEARAKASSVNINGSVPTENEHEQFKNAQNELATAANNLIVTVEKYPELRGTEAFAGLQTQLEGTERRIKVARKDFNIAIANYNSYIKSFPAKLVAAVFGFTIKSGFQSDEGSDKLIEIKF